MIRGSARGRIGGVKIITLFFFATFVSEWSPTTILLYYYFLYNSSFKKDEFYVKP